MRLNIRLGACHAMIIAGLVVSAAPFSSAFAQEGANEAAVDQVTAQAHQAWRESMRHFSPQSKGCFHASYPSMKWDKVTCGPVSSYRATRRTSTGNDEQVVGNGKDYAVQAPSGSLFSQVIGSFPTVTGVTSESTVNVPFPSGQDWGCGYDESCGNTGKNEYTLQLNTNFDFNSAACNGFQNGTDRTGCYSWQQYIVTSNDPNSGTLSGTTDVFIQTWLENYGNDGTCPSGFSDGGPDSPGEDCYQNSPSVVISKTVLPITDLASLKLAGTVTAKGTDSAIATYGTEAYSSSVDDSVSDMANGWNLAEFNIVGNAGAAQAKFNKGSSLTVNLAVEDGSTKSPTCVSNVGYTGETNNLTLSKSCTTAAGTTTKNPYIQFTESLAK